MSAEAPRVQAEGLGKKLCRDPRRSLLYAAADLARELAGQPRPAALRPAEFWALDSISFELAAGECLAILGPNGAGKSTLLRLIHGRMRPDTGRVTVRGRLAAISDLGLGFDPRLTGRANARHAAQLLDLGAAADRSLLDSIVEFSGLGELADAPYSTYSTGMRARLGFAVAAHLEPEVLLIDEALAVGDTAFRRKCLRHMARLAESGRSLAIVSHDLYSLQVLCPRALYLDRGRLVFAGATSDAIAAYLEAQRGEGERSDPTAARTVEPSAERPVVIEAIDLVGADGRAPVSGEPAEVVLRYHARDAIEEVPWFFQLVSADLMIEIGAGIGALESDGARLEAGRGELRARVPKLPLLAGTYGLRGAIVDPYRRTVLALHGYQETPRFVEVRSPADEVARLIRLSRALVEIETERRPVAAAAIDVGAARPGGAT